MTEDRTKPDAHVPTGPGYEASTVPVADRLGGADPNIGRQIGQYRITERIASGGMGTVYLAVQERPRRTVALKLMKRGVTSKSALRRFEFEAQVLARLRHSGIAQVYEAGTHDDGEGGVPFFAMEYVPGATTLIEYAQRKNLDTKERLALFARVCDAVGHGHQKGVIHRDLKPGNILVDGAGQPKIIDFGVARATDSDMAITTLQTQMRQLIGTLQYMSPEQCRGDALDIDVRSDVYALGVVLYELLCGALPYDILDSPVPAAIRIICEQEPARPSTLDRTLRGDVETIALKAMEKERERRYRSADEIGDDVRRHLNDEPIAARPPGLVDAGRRFARKHKAAAVGIVGAFAVVVAVGVVFFAMWGATSRALSNAERANMRAALAAKQQWEAEAPEESAPAAWADDESSRAANEARRNAAAGLVAIDAGRGGEAAEALIGAVGKWREALVLHKTAIPRLIASGIDAAQAGRAVEAEAALEKARGIDLPPHVIAPLAAEVSLLELRMVPIRGGVFQMGDSPLPDPGMKPRHTVAVPSFLLAATEVTQGQFLAVMGRNPAEFKYHWWDGNTLEDDLNRPVESVTWFDAVEFCNALSDRQGRSRRYEIDVKLRTEAGSITAADVRLVDGAGYRLPTEAEWEYACRAGSATAFSFGDGEETALLDEQMWYLSNSDKATHPVGRKKPNAFGLYDMHGNVWELCEDVWHDSYEDAPADGSAWLTGGEPNSRGTLRGGAFRYTPEFCRSATRLKGRPSGSSNEVGFRVALDPSDT